MLKKALMGIVVVVLVAALGLFFCARSILAQDTGRTGLPSHLSNAVGRPVTMKSGGSTLRADIEAVPQGNAITLRKMAIRADDASINVTGDITDRAGPVGKLALKADTLNVDRLLAFVSDFSSGAGMSTGQTAPAG